MLLQLLAVLPRHDSRGAWTAATETDSGGGGGGLKGSSVQISSHWSFWGASPAPTLTADKKGLDGL